MVDDPDALRLAQELCDRGVSNDRISVETGVTKHFIQKWINAGMLKVKVDPYNKKITQRVLTVQRHIDGGMTLEEAAIAARITVKRAIRWKREGKIKCDVQ